MSNNSNWHGTTIVLIRKGKDVVVAGDGQVSLGNTVIKSTAKKVRKIENIEIVGKTGTSENFIKINGIRKQLTDHSIFVGFAPKNNPKIAIAVFVENGYWGTRWAAPIASLMMEKYLNKNINRKYLDKYIKDGNLMKEYLKEYLRAFQDA